MTYADLVNFWTIGYVGICFTALALSLRGKEDTRLLIQTYLIWIAIVFAVTHLIFHEPWKTWHQWWYFFNAAVSAFPIVLAWRLKEAEPRIPIMVFGAFSTILCGIFCILATIYWTWNIDMRLPGEVYYIGSSTLESLQVISLFVFSGPVIPFFKRLIGSITKRSWPWTQHRLLHRF